MIILFGRVAATSRAVSLSAAANSPSRGRRPTTKPVTDSNCGIRAPAQRAADLYGCRRLCTGQLGRPERTGRSERRRAARTSGKLWGFWRSSIQRRGNRPGGIGLRGMQQPRRIGTGATTRVWISEATVPAKATTATAVTLCAPDRLAACIDRASRSLVRVRVPGSLLCQLHSTTDLLCYCHGASMAQGRCLRDRPWCVVPQHVADRAESSGSGREAR
jgi:hypothetical protein